MANKTTTEPTHKQKPECFVIMPISDVEGYESGHFRKVYEDIFKPACEFAGYQPIRADDVLQTNLIHLDVLQKLIDSPMAICDLSSCNPNVLFELGLRQAFDKPTVLVQDMDTPKIFDIAPLRYTEYHRELRYREVIEDQNSIAAAIESTKTATDNNEGVNSIVRILSLAHPAELKNNGRNSDNAMLQLIRAEMSQMRTDFRRAMTSFETAEMRRQRTRSIAPISAHLRMAEQRLAEIEHLLERNTPREAISERIEELRSDLLSMRDMELPTEVQNQIRRYLKKGEDLYQMSLLVAKD